jgi:DNA-binding GntR family transcriptional regulator
MSISRPKSLKELALEHLRDSIINGTLEMGQALSERGISEDLGISKSPVREALAQLRDEGLVVIEPQKRVQVFTLSKEEVVQICDFRQAIEYCAFELALERNPEKFTKEMKSVVAEMTKAQTKGDTKLYLELDTRFHQLSFKFAGNHYLSASYERYVGKIAALRTHLSTLPQHTELSFTEHGSIAEAVQQKDLETIKRLLNEHIDRTRQAYLVVEGKG